jgi:hypothetical protein
MKRFVEGTDRGQSTLFPECLEDWICEDNPVRAIDVFIDEIDLAEVGFTGVDPEVTGEACQARQRVAAVEGDREGDAGLARPADFADRS